MIKKRDRALKRKGYHQTNLKMQGAIRTTSNLKDWKGEIVRTVERAWIK